MLYCCLLKLVIINCFIKKLLALNTLSVDQTFKPNVEVRHNQSIKLFTDLLTSLEPVHSNFAQIGMLMIF